MPEYRNDFPMNRVIPPIIAARTTMDEDSMLELMDSISKNGLFNPVTLVRHTCENQLCREVNHPAQFNDDRAESLYEISAGHRRYTAHKRLNKDVIRALLWEPNELNLLAVRVSENSDVEAWNPADQAIFIAELWNKYNMPVEEMAAMLKKSVAWCDRRYALLAGYDFVFASLKEGQINLSVAEELNKAKCPDCRQGGNPAECPCKNVNGNTCAGTALYYLNNAVMCGASAPLVKQWIYGWKIAVSNPPAAPLEPPPPATDAPPLENQVRCCICGGDKDPWDLKMVYIHPHHIKQFELQLAQLTAEKL